MSFLGDLSETFAIFLRKLGFGASATELERELRRRCRGDEACARRLIDHELALLPGLSRRDACIRAIERLESDMGR